MRDAYLLLCHDNPGQVNALAAHLAAAGHDVFIHMDANSMLQDCIRETERIQLMPRPLSVRWGDWSITAATLMLLRAALSRGKEYRYVHLLSGQCLPAMSMDKLDTRLDAAAAEGKQFVECGLIREDECGSGRGNLYRVKVWYPRCMMSKYDISHRQFWLYTRNCFRVRLFRPGYYLFRPFCKGSQWWSLTGDCAAAVVAYADAHPFFTYFFHHSFCSDESFIQTCVLKAGYGANVAEGNGRYIDWPQEKSPSPRELTEAEWPKVRASGCFFARKFVLDAAGCAAYFAQLRQ